jgi:hypothetical protein
MQGRYNEGGGLPAVQLPHQRWGPVTDVVAEAEERRVSVAPPGGEAEQGHHVPEPSRLVPVFDPRQDGDTAFLRRRCLGHREPDPGFPGRGGHVDEDAVLERLLSAFGIVF